MTLSRIGAFLLSAFWLATSIFLLVAGVLLFSLNLLPCILGNLALCTDVQRIINIDLLAGQMDAGQVNALMIFLPVTALVLSSGAMYAGYHLLIFAFRRRNVAVVPFGVATSAAAVILLLGANFSVNGVLLSWLERLPDTPPSDPEHLLITPAPGWLPVRSRGQMAGLQPVPTTQAPQEMPVPLATESGSVNANSAEPPTTETTAASEQDMLTPEAAATDASVPQITATSAQDVPPPKTNADEAAPITGLLPLHIAGGGIIVFLTVATFMLLTDPDAPTEIAHRTNQCERCGLLFGVNERPVCMLCRHNLQLATTISPSADTILSPGDYLDLSFKLDSLQENVLLRQAVVEIDTQKSPISYDNHAPETWSVELPRSNPGTILLHSPNFVRSGDMLHVRLRIEKRAARQRMQITDYRMIVRAADASNEWNGNDLMTGERQELPLRIKRARWWIVRVYRRLFRQEGD